MRARMGGTIGEHFDAIDTDRDGRITFAELFYAAELTPGEGVPPAHAGHGGRSGKAAVEKAWHEMSEEEQRAFETLGWNEKSWEAADNSPCCKGWYTMSDEERRASQLVGLVEEDFSREVYQRYLQLEQQAEALRRQQSAMDKQAAEERAKLAQERRKVAALREEKAAVEEALVAEMEKLAQLEEEKNGLEQALEEEIVDKNKLEAQLQQLEQGSQRTKATCELLRAENSDLQAQLAAAMDFLEGQS